MEKIWWHFFLAFTTYRQKLCGSLGKAKHWKKKLNFFIINFTHRIRICPKKLHFLTYEIYYISLKHPDALKLSSFKKLSIRPFFCFCTSNGSFRILKKGNIFSKWYNFEEIAKITSFWKIFSSFFQYSERTFASRETNDTSKESSDIQLFWALSGGLHAYCHKKTLKKRVNLTEES